jgi:hypothetical protein
MRAILPILALAIANAAHAEPVSVEASLRERVEFQRNPRLGRSGIEDQTILLHRLLVRGDWQPDPAVRVMIELGNHGVAGDDGPRPPVFRNDLDVHQAVIEFAASDDWRVLMGRQEVALGSGRIIAVRDQPNIRRAFDGARVTGKLGNLSIDMLALRPVENREGVFDDRTNPDEAIWGLSLSHTVPGSLGRIEASFLQNVQENATFADVAGRETRRSLGLRAVRTNGVLQWDWEAWLQTGHVGDASIRAWTIATQTTYGKADWPAGLRFGLKANIASGDAQAGDGLIGTFNALYPRLNYFSEAAAIAPANIMDLHPWIELSPAPRTRLNLEWNSLWRHRRADAVYLAPFVVTPVAGSDRFIANQVNAVATWQADRHVDLRVSWTRFWPGEGLRASGARTQNLLVMQISWRL